MYSSLVGLIEYHAICLQIALFFACHNSFNLQNLPKRIKAFVCSDRRPSKCSIISIPCLTFMNE